MMLTGSAWAKKSPRGTATALAAVVALGLSVAAPVTAAFRLEGTAYYEDKEGFGVSPEAYATSLASYAAQQTILPGLVAPRGLQYGLSTVDGDRAGLVARAIWDLGVHRLTAGAWIETDDYHRTQARYNQVDGSPDGDSLLDEPVHRQRDFTSTRETRQLFVQDVISLLDDRLKIELGIKALDIDYEISGYRNPADYIAQRTPTIRDNWKDSFLPNVGLVWNVTPTEQVFASYAENLALLETRDTGHPLRDTRNLDVPRTAATFRYFGGMADKFQGSVVPVEAGFLDYVLPEPLGVVGQIVPWNFPMPIAGWGFAPALAAGCTIILKPSEVAPMNAMLFADVLHEAGVPAGVFNLINGDGATVGEAMSSHPGIDMMSFTGSTRAGIAVAKAAADGIEPTFDAGS